MSLPSKIQNTPLGADESYVTDTPADPIDIRDHGARLNGSHDDRDAIQSAVDEAAKSGTPDTVYFPSGTIRVSDPVYIRGKHSGITLKGDGASSHLRFDGGHTSNANIFKIYARNDGPLTDLTIRDLRFDGQADKQSAGNVRGITAIESGDGDHGHLLENIWFHDNYAVNCLWGPPGTTIRHISSWGAKKWHGLGLGCELDNSDRPIVVEYCHFWDNGTHGIDASDGHSQIRHVLSEENGWGGKNTGATLSSVWEDVVFRDNENLGFMMSGGISDSLTMDRVSAVDNGLTGFYFQNGCPELNIGEIVALRNNPGSNNGNVYIGDSIDVDADTIRSGSARKGPGLRFGSAPSGTVSRLVHDGGNEGGPMSNDSSVSVGSVSQGDVTPFDPPTNPDSGSGGGSDDSGTDSGTGSGTGDDTADRLPHLLVIDGSDVTDSLAYQLTVSGEIEKSREVGSINQYDKINGATVDGWVTETVDSFRFSGEITHFSTSKSTHTDRLKISVDGTEVPVDELLGASEGDSDSDSDSDSGSDGDTGSGDSGTDDGSGDTTDGTDSGSGDTSDGTDGGGDTDGETTTNTLTLTLEYEGNPGDLTISVNGTDVSLSGD